ncbi:OFA family MFS transporter [Agaribacterium haliotis]|uniref:OFA family MFS transporter n=1 Tax=Agaribacterium haliotis TaxID=2013869 RepID=UPI000BB5384D|nr:OFA family MFS transporter [Agaribacterium haliotis]
MNAATSQATKNRWLIAASAVGVHASIGSVYAFSVFKKPLAKLLPGVSDNEIAWTFSFAIFFLGISAAIMGHFVEKHGPRKSGMLAASFFGGGLLVAGLGAMLENLYIIWLGYGVLGGIGLGIGYITPVSTLVKWFPDRRGLATGLAIMGFGFGAFFGGPLFQKLMTSFGLAYYEVASLAEAALNPAVAAKIAGISDAAAQNQAIAAIVAAKGIYANWFIMGVIYLVVMFASASYLERPPQGWMPEGMKDAIASGKTKKVEDLTQLTANESIKTLPFYGLWLMMFINISCGIAVIYSASPLAQESIGLTAGEAAAVVGLMSLFNGLGRIGWASMSDVLGRANTYMTFFIIQIVAFYLLPNITSVILFQVVLYLILTCYGGGFATLPAFIGDLFGTKQLGAIHGYVLTAWALAGLAGPQLAAYVRTVSGSYEMTLYIFAGVFIFALITSLLMKAYVNRARNALAAQTA